VLDSSWHENREKTQNIVSRRAGSTESEHISCRMGMFSSLKEEEWTLIIAKVHAYKFKQHQQSKLQ